MFAVGVILHYPQQILNTDSPSLFSFLGLTRHAMERIFLLLPITYAGFFLGMKGGLTSLAIALAVMLPRVFLISLYRADALFETGIIIVIGGLVNLWFERYRKEQKRRQHLLSKLESTQQELQLQVQVIRSNAERLSTLNKVSTIVSQSLMLEDFLNVVVDKIRDLVNLEVVLVFLLDEEKQELELKAYRGVSKEFANALKGLKVGEGFSGRAAQTGEPLLIESVSQAPILTREEVKREGIQGGFVVPLKAEGKVVGTLSVTKRGSRQFLDEEIELLITIGNQIGVAIENAHLYRKERFIAEQLRTSEKNYRELFESANEAIWVHDLEGNIQIANKACEKFTGYSIEELCTKNVKSFLSEESLNLAKQVRNKLFQHQHVDFPYEQRLIKKDGTEAICMLTTSLITIDGEPKAFQNIARDVTSEKRMQESLRFYLQQVTRAQEEERKRIARELHDDTAQELVALSRRLDRFIANATHLSTQDISNLEEVRKQADSILDGLRRFSQDLRPSILDDLGLVPALEWLTSDLTNHFGIAVGMGLVGSVHRFSPETELVLFRVAQEALRNVCKHSEASRAWVTLEFGKDRAILTIKDNGKGFSLPERVGDLAKSGKLGLAGMQERVQLVGGRLTLYSKPGEGTTITVEVPI